MRWCTNCILPETRPGIAIPENGVCSACSTHSERRDEVDWEARREQFEEIVERVRARSAPWDCVIPVSGGKDSTWQVVKCIEAGLHPLAVTWRTPVRTELGQRNLDNLISLGADHIDFRINPAVEARFLVESLRRFGTTAIPMHLAIFAIPMRVAARLEIPLVVWGENSAAEYVGVGPDRYGTRLDAEWVRKYGAVHGTTAEDWVSDELTRPQLEPYFGPSDAELADAGVEAIFLGQFFTWDPAATFEIASAHGFEGRAGAPRTGFYSYADIDDDFISIHHYLKWYKFGFTRTFDNLSLEIRNGRLTRDEAIEIVRERGDEMPREDIAAFCNYTGLTSGEFFRISETFRNHEIWSLDDGRWRISDFLIDDWEWSGDDHADG